MRNHDIQRRKLKPRQHRHDVAPAMAFDPALLAGWGIILHMVCTRCVTRRKQHQPGITPNDNTTHMPTARSSAALTKPNHTPTRHPLAKGKMHCTRCAVRPCSAVVAQTAKCSNSIISHPLSQAWYLLYLVCLVLGLKRSCRVQLGCRTACTRGDRVGVPSCV